MKVSLQNIFRSSGGRIQTRWRVLFCTAFVALLYCLLAFRLWQVQVLQGPEHLRRARRQCVRPVRLNPVRGRIFAAGGEVLADNAASYQLVFYVSEMRRGRQKRTIDGILETERSLAAYLGRTPKLTAVQVARQLNYRPVLPLAVMEDLTPAELAALAEYLPPIPGVAVEARLKRSYPYPGLLSHVLGYVQMRQPDGGDVLEDLPRLYVTPEQVGQSGLEGAYNDQLNGQAGSRLLMVDSMGYAREEGGAGIPSVPGKDLRLTIDVVAQRLAEGLLAGHAGAMVVLDVETGAVIAMASAPSFDLASLTSAELVRLNRDEVNRPLLNRAYRGVYTPGSIMKPLLGLAAMERLPDMAAENYTCDGVFVLGKNVGIRCAARAGHGPLDLQHAIAFSCNPFFIRLGLALGLDEYSEFLQAAGVGEKTGIEIGDSAGIMPSREFALKNWKRGWIRSDTAYISIGQGAISLTPLQAAVYAAALANDGIVWQPYLVAEVRSADGEVLEHTPTRIRHRLPVTAAHLRQMREAMRSAVDLPNGSAAGMRQAGIPVAAKTGTAEVGHGENRHNNTWVIAYAPADNPRYALACLVERGRSGGKTAVPLAAEFFRKYFSAGE